MVSVNTPYSVSLTDIRGVEWALTRGAPGRKGLMLMGPPDLQSEVKIAERQTVGQVGSTPVAWSVDKMVGSLDLLVHDTDEDSLSTVWTLLNRGMSTREDAVLRVRTPNVGVAVCRIRVSGRFPMPEKSPGTVGLRSVRVSVPVLSFDGAYRSEPKRATGAVRISNPGDLPLWPKVSWTGASATVQAPGIDLVSLPDAGSATAVLDTNPAFASRVQVGGVDSPVLWRGMRGQFFPSPVEAGETQDWVFTNCSVVYESLHTNPWRW